MTLTVELDAQQMQLLEETARRLNVKVSELARAAIQDLLTRQDEEFERILDRVLAKNAELYRRLA
jgi:hypothetical protein